MAEVIEKGHPLYKKLLDAWVRGGKDKGWVVIKNIGQFKVNRPSDDVVSFVRISQDYYTSVSRGE